MEKIHQPGPEVTVFSLYGYLNGTAAKRYLVLKSGRKNPLLFLSDHHVPVNAHPPASIMRLRKYTGGRRIAQAFAHWIDRRLFFQFVGEPVTWLCLDLREGPQLLFTPPSPMIEPVWPTAHEAGAELLTPEHWRRWPVLTPALRRTLPYLDERDALALLQDLEAGDGDVFLYETDTLKEVSAWPLPAGQLAATGRSWQESTWEQPFSPLALAGEQQVYAQLAANARQAQTKPFATELRRLARLEHKLDQEESRLRTMCAAQQDALLLQQELYRFAPEIKLDKVTLETTEGSTYINLDPRLTVRENMAALFHRAARGKRGLEHLERRRREIQEDKGNIQDALLQSEAGSSKSNSKAPTKNGYKSPASSKRTPSSHFPKQVQAFRSSDGFLILRGRDTKGNTEALRLASPYDYWLHTANGPSAHVIIRRDHARHEVPEQTMQEAGALAALKSWLKDEERAEIQFSLAKYIHSMKKAGPGMVRIDRSEGTFWVSLHPGLEEKLALNIL